jgi:hypothetical protein
LRESSRKKKKNYESGKDVNEMERYKIQNDSKIGDQ